MTNKPTAELISYLDECIRKEEIAQKNVQHRYFPEDLRAVKDRLAEQQQVIDGLTTALKSCVDALEETTEYNGGADNAMQDDYVMGRTQEAIEQGKKALQPKAEVDNA